jgi:hypothetical protein
VTSERARTPANFSDRDVGIDGRIFAGGLTTPVRSGGRATVPNDDARLRSKKLRSGAYRIGPSVPKVQLLEKAKTGSR